MATENYKYTPLTGRRHIRLIKLHPCASLDDPELSVDLVPTLLDAAPPFEALSYAWGDPFPRHEIRCSGRRAEVGPSLYSALCHLRRLQLSGKSPLIWADALCINQNDTAERELQVRMMGDIYSTASITLIWLGEEDDRITRAFDWLRRFQQTWLHFKESPSLVDIPGGVALQARLSGNNYSEARDILQAAFGDESSQTSAFEDIWILLQRPWFMRKWVIQEVVKSKSHRLLFFAGEKYTNWVDLNSWFTFLVLSGYSLQFILSCPWGVNFDANDDTNTHSVFVRGAILAQATISSDWPLCRLLAVTGMFKCIDPSDHIIALLGVAEDSSMFEDLINYETSTDDLWRRLTCSHLNNGLYLKVLWSTLTVVPLERRRGSSWIPNIEEMNSKGANSYWSNLTTNWWRMANACGSTEVDATANGNRLLIRGRIVDVIEQLGTNMTTAFPELKSPRDNSFTAENKRIRGIEVNWLDECQAMAEWADQDEHAFIETMLIDNFVVDDTTEEVTVATAKKNFFRYRRIQEAFAAAPDESTWLKIEESMDSGMISSFRTLSGFLWHMQFRRFGRTPRGRIGWMPLVAEEGDYICVFDGMEFPYAVRQRQGSGDYVLVGDCFIPSLMNGEAMDMPGVESVIMTLE